MEMLIQYYCYEEAKTDIFEERIRLFVPSVDDIITFDGKQDYRVISRIIHEDCNNHPNKHQYDPWVVLNLKKLMSILDE